MTIDFYVVDMPSGRSVSRSGDFSSVSSYERKHKLFGLFLVMNIVASLLNHIDDTDETFGYYEPLHYLLYGNGMQTWEYAPEFAIRTYSFIAALWPFGFLYKMVGLSKPEIFLGIRLILGSFTAYAESRFISATGDVFGLAFMRVNTMILLFSPGIFFSATAFLPSAVAMSLTMLFLGAWLKGEFVMAIAWACVSVLCTGWPFVGLIYLPFGLHMLSRRYSEEGLMKGVVPLCYRGAGVLAFFLALSTAVDFVAYGKLTSPTLNILLYNAGGNGDVLYGVEPTQYYVRNFLLTMTVSWPVSVSAPLIYLKEYLSLPAFASAKTLSVMATFGVVALSAALWLGVLFMRPHKEERFMYPVYPLLAFMATSAILSVCDYVGSAVSEVTGEPRPLPIAEEFRIADEITKSGKAITEKVKEMENKIKGGTWAYRLKHSVLIGFLGVLMTMGVSRVSSNYFNYSGYMRVWQDTYSYIPHRVEASPYLASKDLHTVCVGHEWYYFPSHFFLPENSSLAFVRDGFYGQLPQPYDSSKGILHGSAQTPPQPVNDQNKEEMSRYIAVDECDFSVATVSRNPEEDSTPMLRKMTIFRVPEDRFKLIDEELDLLYFDPASRESVIDQEKSEKAIFRAFSVPFFSFKFNRFKEYLLLAKERIQLGKATEADD